MKKHTLTKQPTIQAQEENTMELIINLYQEKADQALAHMLEAMQEYEVIHDSDLLELSLEWELRAYHYLSLAEKALESI